MNYSRVSSIVGASLRDLLQDKTSRLVVIDCRSFTSYNNGHIKSAINICCPSLLRRRLRRGNASLETLVTCQATLKCLRDNEVKTIVLYDDGGRTSSDDEDTVLASSSTVSVVARLLVNELRKKTYYLKGQWKSRGPRGLSFLNF